MYRKLSCKDYYVHSYSFRKYTERTPLRNCSHEEFIEIQWKENMQDPMHESAEVLGIHCEDRNMKVDTDRVVHSGHKGENLCNLRGRSC